MLIIHDYFQIITIHEPYYRRTISRYTKITQITYKPFV